MSKGEKKDKDGCCDTDKKDSNCPVSKCCSKLGLSCLIRIGAVILLVYSMFNANRAIMNLGNAGNVDTGTLIVSAGGPISFGLFTALVLIGLARVIDLLDKHTSCSTDTKAKGDNACCPASDKEDKK